MLRLLHELAPKVWQAFGHLLQALDFHLAPVKEALAGEQTAAEPERVVRAAFRPHLVLAGGPADGRAAAGGSRLADGRPTAYVRAIRLSAPVTEPSELERPLAAGAPGAWTSRPAAGRLCACKLRAERGVALTPAASRRNKWLVALFWIVVFIGLNAVNIFDLGYADAEQNRNVDYLPGGAESVEVLDQIDEFLRRALRGGGRGVPPRRRTTAGDRVTIARGPLRVCGG